MAFIPTKSGAVFVPDRPPVAKPSEKASVDLSKESILVMDRGLKVYLAQFLSRYFGTVYYHCITGGPYESGPRASIGKDMPGIVHTKKPGQIIRSVPNLTVFYPDIYDGDEQEMLRHFGVAVCGAGAGEIMEMDKLYFHEQAAAAGLPLAKMQLCKGLDDLETYAKKHKGPMFVKLRDEYRDDWETCCLDDPEDTEDLLAHKRDQLGAKRSAEMEFLCYEPIESCCEGGLDGFRLGGELANLISCGYECKDMGYIGKIMDSIPKILQAEIDGLRPAYALSGYAGPYSNESRFVPDGTAYPIDQTCRTGEPPTSGLCEALGESYAVAIFLLARGIMPTLTMEAPYFAQINLSSAYHQDNELHVSFPPGLDQWVKLENAFCRDGKMYCTPNDNDGGFGAVVAIGKSVDEVVNLVLERVKLVSARGLEYGPDTFEEIKEAIEAGRAFGIDL